MHESHQRANFDAVRARAAELIRQAEETSDVWFAEQLRRLSGDLSEYANMLEVEAASQ